MVPARRQDSNPRQFVRAFSIDRLAAKEIFERILVTLPSDVFYAFFRDESRLADFDELEIANLTQVEKETVDQRYSGLPDGYSRRIGLRQQNCACSVYLTNLHASSDIATTVASLVRAGISRDGSDINACFNFAEQLAFQTYQHTSHENDLPFEFEGFLERYKQKYT